MTWTLGLVDRAGTVIRGPWRYDSWNRVQAARRALERDLAGGRKQLGLLGPGIQDGVCWVTAAGVAGVRVEGAPPAPRSEATP